MNAYTKGYVLSLIIGGANGPPAPPLVPTPLSEQEAKVFGGLLDRYSPSPSSCPKMEGF